MKNKYPIVMKKVELSRKLKKKPLLLENSPFNFTELPDNIKFKIFASAEPHQKNQLQTTCTFLHKKGSMQPPYVWDITSNTPLSIEEKDLSRLVLKAVVHEKTNILEKLLENNKKRDFIYEYTDSISTHTSRLCNYYTTFTSKDVRSFDIYQAAPSQAIHNILKKYDCTTLENNPKKTSTQLSPLITACFIEDKIMLIDIIHSQNNFSEYEIHTVLQHIQKVDNPEIKMILATQFPIFYTLREQNLTILQQNDLILEQNDLIKSLTHTCKQLKDANDQLQRNLRDAQDNLETVNHRVRIGYYNTSYNSYSPHVIYPVYPAY